MKTRLIGIIFGSLLIINACTTDDKIFSSDTITTETRFIDNYDGINVSTTFTIDVEFSDTEEKIEIEANKNLHEYVEVDKINGKLIIKLRDGISISGDNVVLKAHIITKNNLVYFSAIGASHIILNNTLDADEVTLNLSDASLFDGSLYANSIVAELTGASNVTLHGSTNSIIANLSGASFLSDFEMVTDNAKIHLSGASDTSLTVNNNIDLVASGASILKYKGGATIGQIELSGASQIIKMD